MCARLRGWLCACARPWTRRVACAKWSAPCNSSRLAPSGAPPTCRSKHQELEAALDQKETEKQMIFSEMLQSKQRQEVLEQRLAKMVEVLMKACHSMGISAVENQELRGMHQQITNDVTGDSQRRYKRARLTVDPNAYKTHAGDMGSAFSRAAGDMGSAFSRAADYSQTDEWLDSLMQGMTRVTEGKAQGGYGSHQMQGGYGSHQMRITNSSGSFSPQFPSSTTLTEIHDDSPFPLEEGGSVGSGLAAAAAKGIESPVLGDIEALDSINKSIAAFSPRAGSKALESPALDSVEGLESINKGISASVYSPRLLEDEARSPLEIKNEHAEDLEKPFDSQTLDLNSIGILVPGERDLSAPPLTSPSMPLSPARPAALRDTSPSLPAAIGEVLTCGQSTEILVHPRLPSSDSVMRTRGE